MPEGQLPPYAIPTQQQQQEQQQQQLSKAPAWALGAFSVVEREQVHTLPPVIAPLPAPPPRPIGEAPRPSSQRPSSSTIPPESLTPTQAASRKDLATIAIQPWPIDYDTDSPTSDIARIRSHYGDMRQPQYDRVLVRFSKKLSIILRHDTKGFEDIWITSVDKSNLPHGIIWPIDDLCRYL